MNLHRLDLVSLSLFNLVVRTGNISRGAELARLAVGAASKRISDLDAMCQMGWLRGWASPCCPMRRRSRICDRWG